MKCLSFYIYETQTGSTCWSCGNWIIGGGCFLDRDNVRQTEHDFRCNEWVKEGTAGTITSEVEIAE